METIREQIIAAIVTAAADILVASGYNTGMGAHVFRAQSKIDPGSLPAVVIWPQPETTERKYGMCINIMPVKLEGLAVYGSDNPSVISEQILGDLIIFMTGRGDHITRVTDDLATDIAYTGGGTETYPEGPEDVAGAFATFNIKYETEFGDPYTKAEG